MQLLVSVYSAVTQCGKLLTSLPIPLHVFVSVICLCHVGVFLLVQGDKKSLHLMIFSGV
jgi:hypothetical protein